MVADPDIQPRRNALLIGEHRGKNTLKNRISPLLSIKKRPLALIAAGLVLTPALAMAEPPISPYRVQPSTTRDGADLVITVETPFERSSRVVAPASSPGLPEAKPESPPVSTTRAQPVPEAKPALGSGFDQWLGGFKDRLVAQDKFDRAFLDENLNDLKFLPRVIELDRKQPEGTLTHAEYLRRVVSDQRINTGKARFVEHRAALREIEETYGVPAEIITSLWGIETSYGAITGGFRVIDALASLSYEGRRREFFERELVNLLTIVEEEQRAPDDFLGSWAGAMGQSQFMPSSFLAYAVDHDGDGKRDIWGTQIDVFASAANYLKQSGWREDQRWGRAVRLPGGFDRSLVTGDVTKPLADWAALGVTLRDGTPLPGAGDDFMARLIQPDGAGGPAFLAYSNYDVILRWNRSNYFATAVGILSDRIAEADR